MAGKSSKTKLAAEILAGFGGLTQGLATGIQENRQYEQRERALSGRERQNTVDTMIQLMKLAQDKQQGGAYEGIQSRQIENTRYGLLLKAMEMMQQGTDSTKDDPFSALGSPTEAERIARGSLDANFFSMPREQQIAELDKQIAEQSEKKGLMFDEDARRRIDGLRMMRSRYIAPGQTQLPRQPPAGLEELIQQLQQQPQGGMMQQQPAVPGAGGPPGMAPGMPTPQTQGPIGMNPGTGAAAVVPPRVDMDGMAMQARQHVMSQPGAGASSASRNVMGSLGETYARTLAAIMNGDEANMLAGSAFLGKQLGEEPWLDVQYLLQGLPFALQNPEEMRK